MKRKEGGRKGVRKEEKIREYETLGIEQRDSTKYFQFAD